MSKLQEKWRSAQDYIKEHERYFFPLFLIGGFILDALTLNRVDQWFDNIVILLYLLLAAASILLIYIRTPLALNIPFYYRFRDFLPFVMQFAFGGLFSALVIFYSKSTSLLTSGPFLFVLIALFLGNEFFHNRYPRLVFQVAVFYVALLSYSLLITPVIIGQISTMVFILGTVISVAFMFGFFSILISCLPESFKAQIKMVRITLGSILVAFYFLYFLNIIPPIPLALKDSGIFHGITRTSAGEYQVLVERPHWYELFRDQSKTYHKLSDEPVYAFSAVFAPSTLNGTIYHEWSYLDEEELRWKSIGKFPITISGGRDQGYRGYSFSSQTFPGTWRVDVETKQGQVIGRMKFKIKEVSRVPQLYRRVY